MTIPTTPRLDGRLGRDDTGRYTLTFRRHLPGNMEAAWEALVSPGGLQAWAPYAPDRRLDEPGAVRLSWVNSDAEPSTGRVIEAEPPRHLVMDWGDGEILHWSLEPVCGGGTLLTLVHVFDDRPQLPSYGAGWEVCLAAMTASLAGDPIGNPGGDAAVDNGWQRLHDEYATKFGRE